MNTNSKILKIITYIYIYLPVLIFVIGYTKAFIWIISVPICIAAIVRMFKDCEYSEDSVIIRWPVIFIVAMLFVTYCIYIGYGGVLQQAGDWAKHNAVLHDLTERSWPVYYTKFENSMLTYYLGQYIIPACVGKIAIAVSGITSYGFITANIVMAIWGMLGIELVFLNLIRITKSSSIFKQFRCAVIMLFFGGALPMVQIVTSGIYGDKMYSVGSYHWLLYNGLLMQYRSNTVMLRWVFPQVIVIWLIIILFLENRDCFKFYVLIFAPVLIYGTFSIVMLSAFAFTYVIYRLVLEEDKKNIIFNVFSIDNILCMLTIGIIFITFFTGYLQVEKPEFMSFKLQVSNISDLLGIIVFDLFMFGIYMICVYKEQKYNPFFWMCLILLSIIPCFKMGLFNDFVMCASIPGLFMLMIWVIQLLNQDNNTKNDGIRLGILMCVLFIGAWYSLVEIKDNFVGLMDNGIYGPADYYVTLEKYSNRDSDEQQDLVYNYFTYDLDGKFFYEYIAKDKIE